MLILGKPKTLGFMRTEVCEPIDHIVHVQMGIPMGLSQAEAGLACQKSNHKTIKQTRKTWAQWTAGPTKPITIDSRILARGERELLEVLRNIPPSSWTVFFSQYTINSWIGSWEIDSILSSVP